MRSCGKDVLDGAYLVCRLSVTSLVGGDLAADVSDDVMGDREVQHFYFHIAHISWSPFMVVFHILKYIESTGTRITLEVPCARTWCVRYTRECFLSTMYTDKWPLAICCALDVSVRSCMVDGVVAHVKRNSK
jgi:hypothetical protein